MECSLGLSVNVSLPSRPPCKTPVLSPVSSLTQSPVLDKGLNLPPPPRENWEILELPLSATDAEDSILGLPIGADVPPRLGISQLKMSPVPRLRDPASAHWPFYLSLIENRFFFHVVCIPIRVFPASTPSSSSPLPLHPSSFCFLLENKWVPKGL